VIQHHHDALFHQIDAPAAEVGVARRRDPDNYLLERIAGRVETIDACLWPTAGDLVRHGFDVERALELVDRHTRRLRAMLTPKAPA
jgi:hypothetical protein